MQPLNSKDWISKDFSKFGVQKINSTVVFGGSTQEDYRPMVRVLKWGNKATNLFFRIVYKKGSNLWLSRSQAMEAVRHGWSMTDFCQHIGSQRYLYHK